MRKVWVLISCWLLAVLFAACDVEPIPVEEGPHIGISIEFPGTGGGTKGEVGNLPASNLENAILCLSVWVFRSDTHEKVTYLDLDPADFPLDGGVRRYSLPVTRDFAEEKPNVDIFILANAQSVRWETLNGESSWETLNNAYFGERNYEPYYDFGISKPVHAVNAELGLPMSGCGKDLPLQGEEPVLRVSTIRLSRAVSRLRYVFCRTNSVGGEAEDEVAITRIVLNGRQIPRKEYVFTTSAMGIVMDDTETLQNNYVAADYTITWPAETAIARNDTPESLIYVNQDPLTYEQLITDAVQAGQLTDLGYTYLRESDRRLVGRIDYTINGKERSREFNMVSAGDFARNHTWTVFGYFLGGRNLQLSLNVLPWDYNTFDVDFSESSVNVSRKLWVEESSVELTETSKDHFDAHLLPGIAAKCHLIITTPVGGRLMIRPSGDTGAFQVTPDVALIDPGTSGGRIDILVRRNPDLDEDLTGKYITLSFSVEIGDRWIDADTEIVDQVYRFIL